MCFTPLPPELAGSASIRWRTKRCAESRISLAWRSPTEIEPSDLESAKIKTLRWHPVRLFSNLERKYYYGAKKKTLDRVAAAFCERGPSIYFTVGQGKPCFPSGSPKNSVSRPFWRYQPGTGTKETWCRYRTDDGNADGEGPASAALVKSLVD